MCLVPVLADPDINEKWNVQIYGTCHQVPDGFQSTIDDVILDFEDQFIVNQIGRAHV